MIIQADREGIEVIQQLCDIALKQRGISVMQGIQEILRAVHELEDTNGRQQEL